MTDAEIIKANELCCLQMICDERECPYGIYEKSKCIEKLGKDTIDLINRLQSDKEALIAGQETLQKALAEKSKEIQGLRNTVVCDISNFASEYDSKIKAETIKEFAEKVKTNRQKFLFSVTAFDKQIDNLVKEMVGDTE